MPELVSILPPQASQPPTTPTSRPPSSALPPSALPSSALPSSAPLSPSPSAVQSPPSPSSSASRKGKGGRKAANPHLTEEERRRERVLKNRESAMKSLLKKKRYTEDLEHRAIALSNRNAELKDKIRTLLARLQAMGIVTSPSVGPYPPVIPTTSPFQRSLPLSTPVSSCLPTDDCAPVLPEFSASAHPLTVQSAQSFSPSLTPQQDPSDALPPSALNHMLALGNSSSATSSSVVGLSQIPDPSFVLGADPIDTKISNAFDLHHMTCTQ